MTQTIVFNSSVNITLTDALIAFSKSFPDESTSGINNLIDLEDKLSSMGQTLFVTIDVDKFNDAFTAKDKEVGDEVLDETDNLHCSAPPMKFDASDITDDCLCCDPPEFPEPIAVAESDLADLVKSLEEDQRKKYGSLEDPNSTGPDEIKDVMTCLSQMQDITDVINKLSTKAGNVLNTVINLEELLYNYRIMESYFKKRLDAMDQILGTFDPLITQKRDYQSQIDLLTPQDAKALDTLNVAKTNLLNGTNGETQAHVNQLQSSYNTIHAQLLDLQKKLKDTEDSIIVEESNIAPFIKEINFENSTDFSGKSISEQESARLQWLNDNIKNLFGVGSFSFNDVSVFSTRTVLTQNEDASAPNQSFFLNIKHSLVDDEAILIGRPKSYINTTTNVTIEDPGSDTPHGILYDKYYNIYGDPDLFFTLEERGLTSDSKQASAQLTGASSFNSNYIQDANTFTKFYENFPANHSNKVSKVKAETIEPALKDVVNGLEVIAIKEIEYLFAYGRAFEQLPSESNKLIGIINSVKQSSEQYTKNILELRTDYAFALDAYNDLLQQIEDKKQEYQNVKCASKVAGPPESAPPQPGSDPLGADSIQQMFPEDPDITKYCYWVKFAAYATAVNVLPIPGNGGLKYWPVGLKIPTPGGIVNVPLPIIWIPVAVIVLTAGIFVIFIGLSGMFPSPFVFFIGANGEKKFILSIRPTDEFGASARDSIIKTIDKGGIAVRTSMNKMLNNISIPGFKKINDPDGSTDLLEDIKNTIIKKVQKIGTPDITALTSRLTTNSTVKEKKDALKEVVSKHLEKLTIPTIKVPKNSENVNPKPLPAIDTINQLTRMFKLDLPLISIPSDQVINLKSKLVSKINDLKAGDVKDVNIAPPDFNTATDIEKEKWADKVRKVLKDGVNIAHTKITPKELGLVTSVLGSGITFINPYKCRPGATGLGIPPLSPAAISGLGILKVSTDAFIDGLSIQMLQKTFSGVISTDIAMKALDGILKALPDVNIPNPSKISIKDLMTDSAKKLVKMQMPSFPDPTKGLQLQIPIPGDALKSAITTGVDAFIDVFPINDIDLSDMSALDVKQLIITIVEGSFSPIESLVGPILNIISKYKSAKDKTLPEVLGLKKVDKEDNMVVTMTKESLDTALKALKVLALIPYPAVAVAPTAFSNVHPILSSDDLPPWKRLTLDNFLFVIFLDQFCTQGKKGSFQPNP